MSGGLPPLGFESAPLLPLAEAYLTLIASIDQVAVQRLTQQLMAALSGGITRIHLLIHSSGGLMGDGVAAYEILRACPIEVWTYSYSNVMSAGAIVYLGGHKRFVAPSSIFMLHRGQAGLQGAHANLVRARADSLSLEDRRLDEIYKAHLRLSPEQWTAYEECELWLSAQESIDVGVADAVRVFSPQRGAPWVNVYNF